MGDKGEFTIFFKKKIEPFVAIGVLIMLILLVLGQVREYNTTKQIKENCGWDLAVSPDVKEMPRPTDEELRLLTLLDPEDLYSD